MEPKFSLSDFKILDPKAFSFFSFQIFFETSKRSVLVLDICELNQNVLFLFLSFWNKYKCFAVAKKNLEQIKKFWFCSKILL